MPSLVSLSPTKAATWLDCRHRYRRQYVERARATQRWAHQSYGLSIHAVLRDWFDLPRPRRTRAAVDELLARSWIDIGYRDVRQQHAAKRRAAHSVGAYLDRLDPAFEPHSRERSLGARTDTITINGRIDRLDADTVDPDALVVVDYKTGRMPPTADDARSSLALAAYATCVEQSLRRRCRRVELHHIGSDAVAAWEHSEATIARQLLRLNRIGAEIAGAERLVATGEASADEVFTPTPGPLCGWCDHRAACPVGAAAAPAREPWAGLPVD